ncbi:MAG: hypothetical protein ACXVEF_32705 [Polyangiales bacterium]
MVFSVRPLALFFVVFALDLAGCDRKPKSQVVQEAKAKADPLRDKLVAAAELVAKQDATPSDSECDAPKKLTFDPKSDEHDTDFMMLQEAKRGGGKADDKNPDESLDLHFAGPFPVTMRVTSPESPVASYMLTDNADESYRAMIRRGLQVKNVVIVRYELAGMEYFLVDLAKSKPKIVCKGMFSPSEDPNAEGEQSEEWEKTTKNKKTGKVVAKETKTVKTNAKAASLYEDAQKQFRTRMKKELGIDLPK